MEYSGSFFYDWIVNGASDYDLDSAVWLALEEFPDDFRSYWGLGAETAPEHLDPDDWEAFQELEALADRLTGAAQRLMRPPRLPDRSLAAPEHLQRERDEHEEKVDELRKRLEREGERADVDMQRIRRFMSEVRLLGPAARHHVFTTCMQIRAADMYMETPGPLANRMLRLLDYLVTTEGVATQQYLQRVAECYIRDMAPELAVMSRAVLEAALEDVVPKDRVREVLSKHPREHVRLSGQIAAASSLGIFDATVERDARDVKQAGDDAVHVNPALIPDADKLMTKLVRVLNQLARFQKREA